MTKKNTKKKRTPEELAKSKIVLLKIYEILRDQTDEQHLLGTQELTAELNGLGFECERRQLYSYLNYMKDFGYLAEGKVGKQKAYYFKESEREISYAQVRFIVDMVQSASFLTKSQTKAIVSSIMMMAGSNKAERLKSEVIRFDDIKHGNETIFDSLVSIDKAIAQNKQISFLYNPLRFNEEVSPKPTICDPIALIFNNGYYYIFCRRLDKERPSIYRLDRMNNVKVEDTPRLITQQTVNELKKDNLKCSLPVFGMWLGETEEVTLRLQNKHLGDIVDKFGNVTCFADTEKDGWFTTTISVNVSPVFLGWCASYGNELEITSPQSVRDKLRKTLENALNQYKS